MPLWSKLRSEPWAKFHCAVGAIVAILLLSPAPSARNSSAHQLLSDCGAVREFEIALDELYLPADRSHRLERLQIVSQPPDSLQRYAQGLESDLGRQTDIVLYESGKPRGDASRRLLTRQVIVRLADQEQRRHVEETFHVTLRPMFVELPQWFVVIADKPGAALDVAEKLRRHPLVRHAQAVLAKRTQKKAILDDPLIDLQWHLRNVGHNGGRNGIDINALAAWESYRGAGVVLGLIDDGLQYLHPDIAPNYVGGLSYDFNDNDPDPAPDPANDTHGTPVAGLAGARGNNGIGVTGVAPDVALAGLRLLGAPDTDIQDAATILFRNDVIWIKNNSWGAPDGTGMLLGAGPLLADAMAASANLGRGGKGVILVFAGGNGRATGDDVNYDGYANSAYALAVAAVNDLGQQASYSEPGACLLISAPSSSGPSFCAGGRQYVATTDLTGTAGYNDAADSCDFSDGDYTKQFGGTSAAAPIVSGVAALILQANTNLSYRDVQEILMRSAKRVSSNDGDWWTNSAGIAHNHKFGAGLIDAGKGTAMAANWMNLEPRQTINVSEKNLSLRIPDNNSAGIVRAYSVTNDGFRVEHVALTITAPHPRHGDLSIMLFSPSGACSRLAEPHASSGPGYQTWTFTSVRHWGESAKGTWTVKILDSAPSHVGTLEALDLELQGSVPRASLSFTLEKENRRLLLRAAAPGWIYVLETSSNLTTWQPVGLLPIGTQGSAVFVESKGANNQRFFRARCTTDN